jgi:GAF domain-containing protein/PAS domain-containing protein
VFRVLGSGLLILGPDDRVLFASEQVAGLLGLSDPPDRLPPQGFSAIDEAGLPVSAASLPWAVARDERRDVSATVRLRGPAGVLELDATCGPLDGAEPIGAVVRLESARVRDDIGVAVGPLHADGRQLSDVLARMPVGFIVVDRARVVRFMNAEIERIWRGPVTIGTIAGAGRLGSRADGTPYGPHDWPVVRALQSGEVVRDERATIERGDGTEGCVSVSAAPLRATDGRIEAAVAIVLDVTEDILTERLSESLAESLQRELANTRLLRVVAGAATTTSDLKVACRRILRALAQELGMLAGFICLSDRPDGPLHMEARFGLPRAAEELTEDWHTCVGDEAPLVEAVRRSGSAQTHEAWTCTAATRHVEEAFELAGDRFAVLPLSYRKQVGGVLYVQFPGRRAFTADEMDLFQAIAHTIGQAIENTRLLQAEKEARVAAAAELELSNMLLETSERFAADLELSEVLETVADSLHRVTGRGRIVLALYDRRSDDLVVAVQRGVDAHMTIGGRWHVTADGGGLSQVVRERRVREITLPAAGGSDRAAPSHAGVRALVMPLVSQDRLVGVAMAAEDPDGAPLTERERRLLEGIATQAAPVIRNATRYDSEHRIAETLQEAMLVMPEHVPGIRYGTLYRSATTAARVGGDFYDIFELDDRSVAIVVGDVSGKGLGAASVTALARTTLRVHASEGHRPSVVLAKTNDALRRFTSYSTFVTAFYGVLDVSTGALVFVNAGHPDACVVGAGGYVRGLGGQSPLLGILEDAVFEEHAALLAPGDTLFLYTDGVTEARRGRELYGIARLEAFLATVPDIDPRSLPEAVLREVGEFSGGTLRDDIAMLAVRREATAEG